MDRIREKKRRGEKKGEQNMMEEGKIGHPEIEIDR